MKTLVWFGDRLVNVANVSYFTFDANDDGRLWFDLHWTGGDVLRVWLEEQDFLQAQLALERITA